MNESDERMIDAAVEGKLSQNWHAAFNKRFHEDAEFRDAYLQQIETDSLLRLRLGRSAEKIGKVRRFPTIRRIWFWIPAAAASLALTFGFAYHFSGYKTPATPVASEPLPVRSSAIAGITLGSAGRVVQSMDADAEGPFGKIKLGSLLYPGTYTVNAGKVTFEFDSGAITHIEAPAQIEVETPFYARLIEGRLTAVVPKTAIGFVIKTPTARIEDFGTSFAVNVSPAGVTKTRVLEGNVEMASLQNQRAARKMYKNDACEVSAGNGELRPIEAKSVTVPEPPPPAAGLPMKYVYWSLNKADAAGCFIDTGTHPNTEHHTLHFENETGSESALVAGRKPGIPAWNFDGTRSALVSDYAGISGNKPRTVSFWIKIPQNTDRRHAYSIIAWGLPHTSSKKWQIAWNAGIEPGQGTPGAIRTEFGNGFVVGSTDLRDGQWHQVTSVFLGDEVLDVVDSIRHYVDGTLEAVTAYKSQIIATKTADIEKAAKILKLGQRLEENDKKDFPAFKGTISDVYVFDGALTPEQINELCETDCPPETVIPVAMPVPAE